MKPLRYTLQTLFMTLILLSQYTKAQNLVPNPSFESPLSCPSGAGQIANSPDWSSATDGNADYFDACAIGGYGTPNNIAGSQTPLTGNSYAGFFAYRPADKRSYAQTRLTQPLTAGKDYCVSFNVSLADLAYVAVEEIGLHFATSQVNVVNGALPLNLTPQIEHNGGVITDKNSWVTISGTFTADDAYEWIVIGNFRSNANTTNAGLPGAGGAFFNRAYYYLDDIAIEEMPDLEVIASPNSIVCAGSDFTLTATGGANYSWVAADAPFDTLSTIDQLILTGVTATRTYIVTAINGICTRQETVTVDVLAQPNANFTYTSACAGHNTYFTDLSTNPYPSAFYTWDFGNGFSAATGGGATYTYPAAGTYEVTLTINSPIGCNVQTTQSVIVADDCNPCSISDNYVENPSMEQYNNCPDTLGQWYYLNNWYSPTSASPDFFHACATGDTDVDVLDNQFGGQAPLSGNAFAGIFAYAPFSYREYIAITLNQPLTPDSVYCVTYNVSLSDFSGRAIENLSAYLSDIPMVSGTQGPLFVAPQIEHSGSIITNQSGWATVQGLYTPNSPNQFLTIGNFADNANTNLANISGSLSGSFDEYAYYYIDQVSVVQLPKLTLPNDTLQACINENVLLAASNHFCGYLWYADDLSANYGTDATAIVTSTTQGLRRYVLRAEFNGCFQTDTIVVNYNNFPTADFETLANCAGNVTLFTNTTANADAATTYYWDFESDLVADITTTGLSNVGHTYLVADTIYSATLIAVSPAGCSDTVSIPVFISGACDPCVQADNTVLNSDFSGTCPTATGQLSNATLWSSPTTDSADLFASCGTGGAGIPTNDFGTQAPYGGSFYGGLRAYSHGNPGTTQELISQQLFTPLTPGVTYCMKMYVSLAESSDYAIDEIGMYCSTNPIDANGTIYQDPQVFNPTNVILFDTLGWREISGSFVADSAYQYLSVGNFNWYPAGTPNTLLVGAPSPDGIAYYYIDDISISPLTAQLPADTAICFGQQLLITANTSTCNYYWTTTDNPSVILSDSLSLLVSPAITTDYVFYGSNGNCDITDTMRVTVNPLPNLTVSDDVAICIGDVTTLTASGSNVSYLWDNGSTDSNISVSPTDTTTYGVIVTDLSTGCQSAGTILVSVNPPPIADAGFDAVLCAGDSVRLAASGGNIFAWQPAPGIDSLDIPDPIVRPTFSTWYYVNVSNTITGCSALDSVLVTVNPDISVADTATVVQCAGAVVQLAHPNIPYGDIISYSWLPTTGLDDPNVAQPNASVSGYTVYELQFIDNNGCSGTAHVAVTVIPIPDAGDDVLICAGGSVSLNASGGGISYSWSPTIGLDDPNIANPTASPTETTTYYVTVVYPNSSASCSQVDSVIVTVAAQGFADINLVSGGIQTDVDGNPIVCENTPILLQAFGGDTYAWESNAGITTPLDNAIVSVQSDVTTTYYVNVSNSATGCPVRDSITVFIVPNTAPDINDVAIAPYYCATFDSPINICLEVAYSGCESLNFGSSDNEGNITTLNAGNNCFFYQPSPAQTTDTFMVSICTDSGLCDQTQIVVVNNICDENAPVWANDNLTASTFESVPVSIALPTANDPDLGDVLNYSLGITANGTVSFGSAGNVIYTPTAGFIGSDQFEVYVCDTYFEVQCDTLTITINVSEQPACTTEEQVVCVRPGAALQLCFDFCLLNNPIIDVSSSTCNYCSLFAGFSANCLIYVPQLGVQNIDTLHVTASDPLTGYTQVATAIINIGCTQPTANPDFTGTTGCVPVVLNVLENDTAPCDDFLFVQLASNNTAHGTATVHVNGSIGYESNAGFVGNDTVFYAACNNCDLGLVCASSFAIVNVQPNNAPIAQDVIITINQLSPVSICVPYSDVEGADVNTTIVTQPTVGGVFYNFNGNCFSYAPSTLLGVLSNSAVFTAQICDDCGNCATSNIVVNLADNEPPISQDTTVTTPYITPIEVCLDVTEPNGDDYDVSIISTTSNGTITLINDSCILFVPAPGYSGTTTIDVLVCDEFDSCDDITTITIVVEPSPINLPPVVAIPAVTTPFNTPVEVCLTVIDPDGDAIVYPITLLDPSCGTVVADDDSACFTFTPDTDFSGTCTVSVTVCDDQGNCTNVDVPITVSASTNSAPAVNFPPINTPFNTAVEVCLAVIDPDGDAIIYPITTIDPSCGTVVADDNSACFTFTPNVGFSGTCLVNVTVCDDQGNCTTVNVPITVGTAANNPPVVPNQTFSTLQDTPIVVCIEATDIDDDALTIANVIPDTNGTISDINSTTLCFTFTPDAGFIGTSTVVVQVCDDNEACDNGIITINVQEPTNLPPIFIDFSTGTILDTPVTVCVDDNVTDPNGDPLVVTIATGAANGIANSGTPGDLCFTYTPNDGFVGTDTIDVTVCDPDGLCTVGQVFITVTFQNTAPVITAVGPYILSPGESISVCTVIEDLEGNLFEVSIAGVEPNVGSVTLVPDADCPLGEAVLIVPPADYLGTIVTTLTACDNLGACSTTPFVAIVVNDTPVINDQTVGGLQNEVITICPTFIDEIGFDIILTVIGAPDNGTATANATNCITYTPNVGFIGTDTVVVVLCDNYGACDTASLYFNIADAYFAFDDAAATEDAVSITIAVQSNDTGAAATDEMTISSAPNNGTAVVSGNTVIYTPNADYIGTDTFYYVICDNTPSTNYGCDTAMVVINVSNNLDANDDNVTTPQNTSINIDVQSNDVTPADIVPTVLVPPINGTIIANGSGGFTYLPNATFAGLDSFTYIISYPGYGSDTATVYITVTPDNTPDPIIALNDAATTTQGDAVTVNVLGNDSNPNGNVLTVTQIVTAPATGTTTINTDGTITYTPAAGFSGIETFVYEVCDAVLNLCATATVSITVVADVNCTVIVHGAISPNGDNYNEELIIEGLDGCAENANNTFTVYNRWGNEVYKASNYGTGDWWNGTWQNNNEPLPTGTYYYVLDIEGQEVRKGYIEITR